MVSWLAGSLHAKKQSSLPLHVYCIAAYTPLFCESLVRITLSHRRCLNSAHQLTRVHLWLSTQPGCRPYWQTQNKSKQAPVGWYSQISFFSLALYETVYYEAWVITLELKSISLLIAGGRSRLQMKPTALKGHIGNSSSHSYCFTLVGKTKSLSRILE